VTLLTYYFTMFAEWYFNHPVVQVFGGIIVVVCALWYAYKLLIIHDEF